MKRLLIFSVLFTPLALAVFVAPMLDRDTEAAMFVWMLGVAYPIVIVPAWLRAA